MIRVTVTGSECTGKTTLAQALAERCGAILVPEFARIFVEDKGSSPLAADVEAIARGQIELEETLALEAVDLLVLDTDLLSTWVYANHYFGSCPEWIGEAVTRRRSHAYLLAGIDVPWVADGDQRDRGHCRPEMQALFHRELEARDFDFVEVSGSLDRRLETAVAVIERLRNS